MSIPGSRRDHRGRGRRPNTLRRALTGAIVAATAAAIAFGGTSAAVAVPVAASAHPAASADQASAVTKGGAGRTVTSKMTKVPVTKLVTSTPDRAGNVKVLLANGKTVPIPADDKDRVMRRAAQQAKVHPEGTVYGDCGSSYITLEEKSNRYPVAIRTGFKVDEPAVGYDWFATVYGPHYTHEYTSGGDLFFDSSWDGGYQSDQNQAEGLYVAEVDPGASDAVLLTGDVCFSGGPFDLAYLTVPKAACLNAMPNGAVTSGGGWISNTTAPVAHRNKTTTPPGPAGTRASAAQACLRKPLGKGSTATGDITGWQDAQKFVATVSPGTTIARCHLIANTLGGKGQIRDGGQNNLVPCWQVGMNTGTPSMRTYEAQVKTAVTAASMGPDDAVFYQVTPDYFDATSTIPYGVTMSATVERANGTTQSLFSNVFITNSQASSGFNLGN